MAYASGNTGKIAFVKDPDDLGDELDLSISHNNVLFWRFAEKAVEYKTVTPYPKFVTDGNQELHAQGRIRWECFVRFLSRTNVADGDLSTLPASFQVWSTTDNGTGINYRKGYGYASDIVSIGDRRGAVIVECMVRSALGRLTKNP